MSEDFSHKWPKDTLSAKLAFYGDPRSEHTRSKWEAENLILIRPPFQMFYEGKPIQGIRVHKKCSDAFLGAFNDISQYCHHDQKEVNATGASDYGGCYNPRLIRGSTTEWSNHSFGCAIDLSPGTNGFNAKTTLSSIVIKAFKAQGARWGGDYLHRKDPMHFEFVS